MGLRGYFSKTNVLFPTQLLNTAVSGELLSLSKKFQYAVNLVNMIPDTGRAGLGIKRYGTKEYTTAIPSGNIIELFRFIDDNGVFQLLCYSDEGVIYKWDDPSWTSLKTGLATDVTPRSIDFNEKLIIFNGVDDNLIWDGTTLSIMEELVEDQALNLTQINNVQVSFEPAQGADHRYNTSDEVELRFDTTGIVTAVPTGVSYVAPTLTLTFAAGVLPDPVETLERVRYTDRPPAFEYMFPQHFRIWALTGGDLKVYYTEFTNNENGWFNAATQSVPFINMENSHPVNDEFVSMEAIEGQMLFFGKEAYQIWTGTVPVAGGDFSFNKSVPVGTVNGSLTQHYPQDVVVTTEYGIRSVRLATVTASLEYQTDIGSNIDPTVQDDAAALKLSAAKQRDARSFSYVRDGLYGFKIDDNVLVYVLSEETRGWTIFTGAFTNSKAFLDFDGQLLLTKDDKVLVYANGADGVAPVYSDDGDTYQTIWRTPSLEPSGRYANRKVELILQRDLNPATVEITRILGNNENNTITKTLDIDTRRSDWDSDLWDVAIWDFVKETRPLLRDKYIANAIAYEIKTNNTEPFGLVGFNLIGGS